MSSINPPSDQVVAAEALLSLFETFGDDSMEKKIENLPHKYPRLEPPNKDNKDNNNNNDDDDDDDDYFVCCRRRITKKPSEKNEKEIPKKGYHVVRRNENGFDFHYYFNDILIAQAKSEKDLLFKIPKNSYYYRAAYFGYVGYNLSYKEIMEGEFYNFYVKDLVQTRMNFVVNPENKKELMKFCEAGQNHDNFVQCKFKRDRFKTQQTCFGCNKKVSYSKKFTLETTLTDAYHIEETWSFCDTCFVPVSNILACYNNLWWASKPLMDDDGKPYGHQGYIAFKGIWDNPDIEKFFTDEMKETSNDFMSILFTDFVKAVMGLQTCEESKIPHFAFLEKTK
jgi:hypothetical protein